MALTETKGRKASNSLLVGLSVAVLISALLGWHFVLHPNEVSTDDAQIDGHVHPDQHSNRRDHHLGEPKC